MPEPELQSTSPWVSRLVAAGTFVLGLLLGVLVTWIGSDSGSLELDGDAGAPTPAETSATPGDDATPSAAQACLEAADAVEEAVALIRGGAAATRDFQPAELVEVLNQLEDLDPRLRDLADRCAGAAR